MQRFWASPWHHSLRPLAAAYAAGLGLRQQLYARRWWRRWGAAVPVLSVGGLEVGGSGKTPVVAYLLELLLEMGYRPGLLSRGYGRRQRQLQVRQRGALASAAALGDEAAMLVGLGLDVPVAVHRQRRLAAQALASHGCDCLLLDDGFAHWALLRQLDIVVLRQAAPFANGCLLPAGPLREPPSSLRRAQVVWLHDKRPLPPVAPATSATPAWLARYCPAALCVQSYLQTTGLVSLQGQWRAPGPCQALAVAGIAQPEDFKATLLAAGVRLQGYRVFADHHHYRPADVAQLLRQMQRCNASEVVTTAKDAVKLAPLWPQPERLWVLQTRVVLKTGAAALRQKLVSVLSDTAFSQALGNNATM